ncbi:uncharacterized protein [Patagioenas fasciata]|uniref:Uncharacterized protein n=1 Tax=Patagioenas fasciata monilis TaxID=372326 RepID=A0A1V4JWN4_PATFA|nr:hypothetical protein AV530_016263 [Patagioenas fasciata monilis]
MAETVGVTSRDEEEIQNNNEDPFPNCDALTTSSGHSASPLSASLNEDKGSSAVPERLSVLSSKAMAQAKALAGPKMVSGGQAQRTTSGLAEHQTTAVNASLGGLSYLPAVCDLQPVAVASSCSKSPCCDDNLSLDGATEPPQVAALPGTNPGGYHRCTGSHMTQAGSDAEGNTAPCSLSQTIWMKTAKVTEALENRKKEEKEKYRLQLAMYRRLLLLRSIRSLHKQLEQQQARLQECYGTVINTKKEVLKRIRSTSTSPSP